MAGSICPMTSDGLVIADDGVARPAWAAARPCLRAYYDRVCVVPVRDERGVVDLVSLEAFQSRLSWATILRKRAAFRQAFAEFAPDAVAAFDSDDVSRLLADPAIVRNRRKIEATITNAAATVALRERGGLAEFVWSFQPDHTPTPRTMAEVPTYSPESIALSRALKRAGFTFVGPTTMFALMEAIGIVDTHLLGSHRRGSSGLW